MHECEELEEDKGFLSALRLCKPPLVEEVYPLHEEEECQQLKTMLRWSLLPTKPLDLQSIRNYFGWHFTSLATVVCNFLYIHVLMRDERRKEERRKQGQTNNKAKQHSTPKAVTFLRK